LIRGGYRSATKETLSFSISLRKRQSRAQSEAGKECRVLSLREKLKKNLFQNLSKLFVHGNICFKDRSAFFPRFALKAPPFGMSSGRFRSLSEKEHEHFFYKHELSLIARKLSINYFSFHRFAQISRMIEKNI